MSKNGTASDTTNADHGNLTSSYILVYKFLRKHGHTKAADSLKKTAKEVVVLKDELLEEGDSLEEVISFWKTKQNEESSDSSDSDSGSDDDSSSDSDSSTSSSSSSSASSATSKPSVKESQAKPSRTATTPPASKSNSSDSSSSGSDSDSDSDEDSDSSSDENEEEAKPVVAKPVAKKAVEKEEDSSSSDSDDSESDSSDESEASEKPKPKKTVKTPKPEVKVNGATKPQQDHAVVTKKRKITEGGSSVPTAVSVAEAPGDEPTAGKGQQNGNNGKPGKQPRKQNNPFQRIKADAITFADDRLRDNSFYARGAGANDYGERASRDLIVTRGDGFRKEKNKKKRGSYRGGEITMQSHAIKFT